MKRRPDLPPRLRGRVARRMTAAAALGVFELPVCRDCGRVHYPVQEVCRSCLSDRLAWQPVEPTGTVLAHTFIRHSTDAFFTRHRPILSGTVQFDAGPVVFARLAKGCEAAGTRVRLFNRLDRSGEAILVAMPEDATRETNVMQDPNRDIAGKVVLVTGADGGIGRALVTAFVKAGAAEVIAAARRPAEAADQGDDPTVRRIVLDVTDEAAIAAAAREVGERVDILVNNAGVTAISGLLDADTTDGARAEMDVNYFGTLNMIRALAPHMKARRQGVIVNVLTVLAHVNLPSMGSYCASKAAALSLTQGVRAELMPWGIRVCAIFPSTVDTPASADSPPPKLRPSQIADAILMMIAEGLEDHYPGRIASDLVSGWRDAPKVVERELGMGLPEPR